MNLSPPAADCTYVLVTGVNSGLGFAICCRLIDDFLATRPIPNSLHLILTTRDIPKSTVTCSRLYQHLRRHPLQARRRITLRPEQVDLIDLRSVQILSQSLLRSIPKLDSVLLNAGYGGFTGINWPIAIWRVLTQFPHSVTYASYKLSGVGYTVPPLSPLDNGTDTPVVSTVTSKNPQPPLAKVFCANVFGHYLLVHFLSPLLCASSSGRIIWISSLEAYAKALSPDDIQGLRSPQAYESSKRLTDILALTSSLPSTRLFVSRFLFVSPKNALISPSLYAHPKIYLSHPGICATAIVPLHFLLFYVMTMAMYLARWVGSPWHPVQPYLGACAPVWLALGSQEELDAMEQGTGGTIDATSVSPSLMNMDTNQGTKTGGGKGKWGTSTNRAGRERVRRTEVEGYGIGGEQDDQDTFEELGRACWQQMEALREEWEARLAGE